VEVRLHDPHAGRTSADVLRLVLDAVNHRDGEALVELLDPDVELYPIFASLEGGYRGQAGARRWLRSLELDWEVYETRLEQVYDLGGSALGLGGWDARGRTSGVELHTQAGAWHARVRDGRVVWWRTYTDRAEALQSLEPSEPRPDRPRVRRRGVVEGHRPTNQPLKTAASSGRSPTG
jgi:ketosteroid isomerase-like protein